jgi:hypothetical protein
MRGMANMTAGSRFVQCARGDAQCVDWLGGGSTVPFVRNQLLSWLAGLGA